MEKKIFSLCSAVNFEMLVMKEHMNWTVHKNLLQQVKPGAAVKALPIRLCWTSLKFIDSRSNMSQIDFLLDNATFLLRTQWFALFYVG